MSRHYASFNLVVHYPSSEKGQEELKTRVAEVHSDKINRVLESLGWSSEEKVRLIDAIMKKRNT